VCGDVQVSLLLLPLLIVLLLLVLPLLLLLTPPRSIRFMIRKAIATALGLIGAMA
jgi:hypothetical protein